MIKLGNLFASGGETLKPPHMKTTAKYLILAGLLFAGLAALAPRSHAQGGLPLWTNAPGGSAIAVDGKGNAFVTGGDATIKYSSAGLPLWTNLFGGRAIAVDSAGDVVVSGGGTAKISSAGTSVWTNNSAGYAMVIDNSGDIYVTSSSFSEGSDYVSTKISSAGVAVWTNRYDGGGRDYAQAIAVDGSGNVFVTGYSESRGSAFTHDYLTIAYSSAGELLWLDSYTGITTDGDNYASAIATDSSGNVFVTGLSTSVGGRDDYRDFATIKYSPAGVPLWIKRYNGPANLDDAALAAC